MNTGIIIQARTGSTRLPNKMILPFYKGKGILESIFLRLKNEHLNIPIILATTDNTSDDRLVEIARNYNVEVYRGSEENVLNRFIGAAETFKIGKIIRLCADNPFLDLKAIKVQINEFERSSVDYWCYSLTDQTPTIKTHYGFWTEGVTLNALNQIIASTNSKLYHEHVTNYIYTNETKFRIHHEAIPFEVEKEKHIRLTIDTSKDFQLAKEIYEKAVDNNIDFTANGLINFIKPNKRWIKIMTEEILKNLK